MGRKPLRDVLTPEKWRARHLPGQPSRIVADPELRAFIDVYLPRMTFTELAVAARAKFGASRAPGRSAIHRYWQRVSTED